MRRLLPLLLLLLLAAPAHAIAERTRCTKRIVFVQDSVRVAKAADGVFFACQGRSRKSYELGAARQFDSPGRYLTYVDADDRFMRLDIRSGDRLVLDRSGPYRLLGAMRIGSLAWASGDQLRFYDEYTDKTQSATTGDPATFAFGQNVMPYWRTPEDAVQHADYGYVWPGPFRATLPRHQRSDRPRCKRNLVFLRKPVRVVRTADGELLACTPSGQHDLGAAWALRAAGPWLAYTHQAGDDVDLSLLTVRTGDRHRLTREEAFFGFVGGLLPDGTVAWTETTLTDDETIKTLRVWWAGDEGPVVVDESVTPSSRPSDEGIDPGSVALSADRWVYWRDAGDVVRGRGPGA